MLFPGGEDRPQPARDHFDGFALGLGDASSIAGYLLDAFPCETSARIVSVSLALAVGERFDPAGNNHSHHWRSAGTG